MKLTDASIRNAQPSLKAKKLSDGQGLYLFIKPNGSKLFRGKYRFQGKEKTASYGAYPQVSLKEARKKHTAMRADLDKGIDPSCRCQEKAAGSDTGLFRIVAEEWYQTKIEQWAEPTRTKRRALLDNDLLPWLRAKQCTDIKPKDLLKVLRRIEERGALDTARNARQVLNEICKYAIWTQRIEVNPASDLQGALKPVKTKHHPAIIDPLPLGELLQKINDYTGRYSTRMILRLMPHVFQRPDNVRKMEWSEIDWEKREWRIPAHKMKMGEAHIVPLSAQAIAILEDIQPFSGERKYVFTGQTSEHDNCISENTINKALRRMGYCTRNDHCAHGFRATARTMLVEQLGFDEAVIEQQLAHTVRDPLGRAYNRTKHLEERSKMMNEWSNYLANLPKNVKIS